MNTDQSKDKNKIARKSRRKIREGVVLSDKMDKTIVVRLQRKTTHKKYKRVIRCATKVKVHDAENQAKLADRVRIMQTRPFSKEKRWRLVNILKE